MRVVIALVLWAGCSFSAKNAPGDSAKDTGGGGSDAAIATGRQQMEIVAGAGRVTAGTKTIDIEIGEAVPVRTSGVGTITLTGAQVVQP